MSYFHSDCRKISETAMQDLQVFKNCGYLVLLSIRQPFYNMPIQMADVWSNGRDSKYLFGYKRAGFDFLQNHGARLQKIAQDAKRNDDLDSLILAFLEVPNMGIVKASFFAQMTVGNGACLDTHNLNRLGLPDTFFRFPKSLKIEMVHKRIRAYNAIWQSEGDSAYWWDSWCDYVAKQNRNKFESGFQVSKFHRIVLGDNI